jgi:hypothetical protein
MIVRPLISFVTGALAVALFVLGCATAGSSYALKKCDLLMPGEFGIPGGLLELAPGESVQLGRPMMFTFPYAPPDSIPANCAVRWSADAGATITESGLVTISSDAVPGSRVTVRAQAESLVAEANILVVDPAPNPLAGMWTQSEGPVCESGFQPPEAAVRELIFRRGGTFAVTRVPFETFQDYWGTYSYDASTGSLTLHASGGNNVPASRSREFIARVTGDELRLEGGVLAGPHADMLDHRCTSVFKKAGAPR